MPYPIDQAKRWQYAPTKNLLGGINTTEAADTLADNEALQLHNVYAAAGSLQVDSGYIPFGAAVVGTPQITHKFNRRDTTLDEMLITTSTVYKWSTSLLKWILIRGTSGTTAAATYYAGNTVIHVASGTGFTTGDLVGITLDNGDQHQTTVTVAGDFLTLTAGVPVGRSIPSGNAVIRAVALTGDTDHQVTAVTIPGSDWMAFTNGINIVQYYDGTSCQVVPNLPSAGNTICESLALYNSALFLLNTTEGGTNHAQRVRRSDQTDPTNWTTGTSGWDDLLDSDDIIRCGVVLGPYLIIYRDDSIARGSFIGANGLNYFFETTIRSEGAVSSHAVIDLGDYHILFGHLNVYEYRGDFSLPPIGDNIFQKVFSASGDLNPGYKHRAHALRVDGLNEAWIFYPTILSSDGNCDAVLRYSIKKRLWYTRAFPDHIIGTGTYIKQTSTSWLALVGDWLAQTWAWNSRTSQANTETINLCSVTAGAVFAYDYSATLDNTTVIGYIVETKDFAMPDAEFRFDTIEMYIQGSNVALDYSTDAGYSWNTLANITQTLQNKVRVSKQIVAHRIRFRWSGTDTSFKLEWFGFSFKIESLY